MFVEAIEKTPLSTVEADAFFGDKVTGGKFYGDATFLSTLRALVYPRIKDTDRTFNVSQFSATDKEDIKNLFRKREDSLIVYSLSSNLMGEIEEDILNNDTFGNFVRIKKITEFFTKSFKVYCYADESIRQCVLLVSPMTVRVNHYLQCSIVAFLPWYFKNEEGKIGVSHDEMDLIQSLREKNSSIYMEAIEKIANHFDIRSAYVRQELHDIGNVVWRQRLVAIDDEIERDRNTIRDLNTRLSRRITELNDRLVERVGLSQKTNTEDDGIMNLFLKRKNLILIPNGHTSTTGDIFFVVRGYLDFYDEDVAEAFIKNGKSVLYEFNSKDVTREGQKRILTELFMTHEYGLKIRFCAEYKISLSGNIVQGIDHASYPPECGTYMPNPHIDRYACLGDNGRLMSDCLIKGDFVGCIEQCMSSCYGLNFNDSYVMREFVERLFCDNKKCIELPTGEVVNVAEALEWIADKEKEQENE